MSQLHQKTQYGEGMRGAAVQPGDRVLVKAIAWNGKHEIADRWEDIPYWNSQILKFQYIWV